MSNTAIEHVRQIVEQNRQQHGVGQEVNAKSTVKRVGIVGAGRMGTAIAAAHLRHCIPVVIHDLSDTALQNAWPLIAAELGKSTADIQSVVGRLVHLTNDLAEMASCDLVLEAVAETLAAKLDVYSRLQLNLAKHTIVASNTSTIPIGRLAQGATDASRFCGMHFCHPVHRRPLVEIVRGPETSDETATTAVAHAFAIEKIPIVVQDGPGFVVNRLLFPYLGEALELLREGASIEAIDRAATDFGMAMGPLRLMDEIGLDTTLQAAWVLSAAFPERIVSSPLLVSLIKAGRLGQKSGGGFFSYREPMSDEVIGPAIAEIAPMVARCVYSQRPETDISPERLILPMLLEATRILGDGRASHPRDIDLAVLFGLGFPVETGGLMFWADTQGAKRILSSLGSLAELGPRAEPTPLLSTWASHGGKFYR